MGYQLFRRRQIDAINVCMSNGRSTTREINRLRTSFASHGDDFATGRPTNNAVINKKHISIFELHWHSVQLPSNPFLPGRLFWHNEGAEYVAIFYKAETVGLLQVARYARRGGDRSLWNRNDHINV